MIHNFIVCTLEFQSQPISYRYVEIERTALGLGLCICQYLVASSGTILCNMLFPFTSDGKSDSDVVVRNLTTGFSSALFPRFRYVCTSIPVDLMLDP